MHLHQTTKAPQSRELFLLPVLIYVALSFRGELVQGFSTACTIYSSRLTRLTNPCLPPNTQVQATVDPFQDGAPNLYIILGASPKDSDSTLKRKWQQLARKLHPDANINVDASADDPAAAAFPKAHPYDISDVNAAWGVLSNPKERRRYDRELQAKEMADNFEAIMDAGIRNAIPFLQKTAESTVQAVETSAKTWTDVSQKSNKVMADVNKRMTTAAAIFDLESDSRELEMNAARAMAKATQIETQINTQNDRRMESLNAPNSRLTSVDASRILQKFNLTTMEQPATANEIAVLEKIERDYKDKSFQHQQMERALGAASREAMEAIRAEERAEERLRQAQMDLVSARAKNAQAQKAKFKAVQSEQDAMMRSSKSSGKLREQTEHVRNYLQRNEDQTMHREAITLQLKKQQLEESAAEVRRKAREIKVKADELRKKAKEEEDAST